MIVGTCGGGQYTAIASSCCCKSVIRHFTPRSNSVGTTEYKEWEVLTISLLLNQGTAGTDHYFCAIFCVENCPWGTLFPWRYFCCKCWHLQQAFGPMVAPRGFVMATFLHHLFFHGSQGYVHCPYSFVTITLWSSLDWDDRPIVA